MRKDQEKRNSKIDAFPIDTNEHQCLDIDSKSVQCAMAWCGMWVSANLDTFSIHKHS